VSQPILEYSEQRIGRVWNETDHLELMHALHEIERTVAAMVRRAEKPALPPHPITEADILRAEASRD
jgi:hypothetical protein